MSNKLSRLDRISLIIKDLEKLPAARNALEAYKMISETINQREDLIWGRDHWSPPRSFMDGERTQRLYPIMPESFFLIDEFLGVTLLLSRKEIIFISRYGAFEFQYKIEDDPYGKRVKFCERKEYVILSKLDFYEDGVWSYKNRS